MEIKLNNINGLVDAMRTVYITKRNYSKDDLLKSLYQYNNITEKMPCNSDMLRELGLVLKIGKAHTTLASFIDLAFSVRGLHRAAQDDLDSHAKRMDNRIIRTSTRHKSKDGFDGNQISNYYKGKILTFSDYSHLLPIEIEQGGVKYVKNSIGYINEEYKDNHDVIRGLYPLSISSDCEFKCNLAAWAHIYQHRGEHGAAHPELKELAESATSQIEEWTRGLVDRFFLLGVVN